ncbi:hypothetical protein [Streptomyces sp. NPDC047097]|uniref:hypothetical protein n=1 Tax=Streptomyces sp. NPDC047097 TaxID=3155260 RepID=UPI0033C1671C
MAWKKNVRAGVLSILAPTGASPPTHYVSEGCSGDLNGRLEELNALLSAITSTMPEAKGPADSKAHKRLSSLRLAAVMGSFVSAAVSAGLAAVALAADTRWPILVIGLVSAFSLVAVAFFLAALRFSLDRRMRRNSELYATLHSLADERVEDLTVNRLVRKSQTDPTAALTLLMQIVAEYGQASGLRDGTADADHHHDTARRVMQSVDPSHPVKQTLTLMVSDLQEKSA